MDLKKIIKKCYEWDRNSSRQMSKARRFVSNTSVIGALCITALVMPPQKYLLLIPAPYIIVLEIIWAFFYGDLFVEVIRHFTPKVSWNLKKHLLILSAFALTLIVFNIFLALPAISNKYCSRGISLADNSDYKDAVKYFDIAVGLNPKNEIAYHWRGYVNDYLSNYGTAIDDYSKAIQLNPKDFMLYRRRGWSYRALGKYEMSVADYNKAIQINPKDYDTYIGLGDTFCRMYNFNAALFDYNEAIKINPLKTYGYNGRGCAYESMDNYSAALADYNKAAKINPQDDYAYERIGCTYYDMDDFEKAISNWKKAAAIKPSLAGKMTWWINEARKKSLTHRNNKTPAPNLSGF